MQNIEAVKIEELEEMGHRNTICEAVMNVEDALKVAYPNATFMIIAKDLHLDKDRRPIKYRIVTKVGNADDITLEAIEHAETTPWLKDMCINSALSIIASNSPQKIISKEAAIFHDATLDYAKYLKIDITDYTYCRESQKWKEKLAPPKEDIYSGHMIGQKVSPLELEQHISEVRQELKRLEEMRDPTTMHRMINNEIKRLKRKNDLQGAKSLQNELDAYQSEVEHKKIIREMRLENLKKAREAKERKAKQKFQQPNFAKMAKARRQQIADRKAKKKKSSTNDDSIKSCSQLLK